jgi:FdhD protein
MNKNKKKLEKVLRPLVNNPKLTNEIIVTDENKKKIKVHSVVERPLTLFLNDQEIVTMMTICDYPKYLAIGYLLNQNMLKKNDKITGVDYDEEISTVVVRTKLKTNYEDKLKKKTLTSGCAQGTVFGDIMEEFENIKLSKTAKIKASWMIKLLKEINTTPSLYLKARAIHGCVLCEKDNVKVYMEDVGRHNAVDKIAGYMYKHSITPVDKIFYTTGRLTSEMIIKTVKMKIPILISRNGFTSWGVELAKKSNLTLIGRTKGKRFIALSGTKRIIYDTK